MIKPMGKGVYILAGTIMVAVAAVALYIAGVRAPAYETAIVQHGGIVQNVMASGSVESPTNINLHFKSSGTLTALNAKVGQKVSRGDVLARQDSGILSAQLAQAQAAVSAQSAALRKLQAGATPQTIAVAQAGRDVADQSLRNTYASVQNTLEDSYAKASDAVQNQLSQFFSNPKSTNPQLTFSVSSADVASKISAQRVQAGIELENWQIENAVNAGTSNTSRLDQVLAKAGDHLMQIQALMNTAVTVVASNISLSAANATTYGGYAYAGLSEVNTAISNIQKLQQSIASGKAALAKAEAELSLATASATQNDIEAQEALVAQARANVVAIEAQLRDLRLVAPAPGTVTNTHGAIGEIIGPEKSVVSIIPSGSLEIRVNVSEENIVGVREGQKVRIELDAFSAGNIFSGTVVAVDPAQTIIGGAVYYETTVVFDQNYEGIRPGMTANVWIETGSKADALIVPASAIERRGGSAIVRVANNGSAEERTVTTGLVGADGMIEIIAGVSEGERVVVGEK